MTIRNAYLDDRRHETGFDRFQKRCSQVISGIIDVDFRLRHRIDKYRSRRQLRELDERMLKDIGVTREEALEEVRRGFFE